MSDAFRPQIRDKPFSVPLSCGTQDVPFQWKSLPLKPSAQISLALVPQMSAAPVVGPLMLVHVVPFQRSHTESPTAQTSFADGPQTPRIRLVVPDGEFDQLVPFHRRILPESPIAQASA